MLSNSCLLASPLTLARRPRHPHVPLTLGQGLLLAVQLRRRVRRRGLSLHMLLLPCRLVSRAECLCSCRCTRSRFPREPNPRNQCIQLPVQPLRSLRFPFWLEEGVVGFCRVGVALLLVGLGLGLEGVVGVAGSGWRLGERQGGGFRCAVAALVEGSGGRVLRSVSGVRMGAQRQGQACQRDGRIRGRGKSQRTAMQCKAKQCERRGRGAPLLSYLVLLWEDGAMTESFLSRSVEVERLVSARLR